MSRSVSAPSSVTKTSPCWNGLIVPGSTLRYGSHFCRVTLKPRLSRRQPIEEAATPFPREETTPPVTKIYFGAILIARVALPGLYALHRIDVHRIMAATDVSVKSNTLFPRNDFSSLARRTAFLVHRVASSAESWLRMVAFPVQDLNIFPRFRRNRH